MRSIENQDEALVEVSVRMERMKDDDEAWKLGSIALQFSVKMLYRLGLGVCVLKPLAPRSRKSQDGTI